jgi:hypothetical protein
MLTAPGRLAAAPQGGTGPDRETRLGAGALTPPLPRVACGDLSPRGARFVRRGSHQARWSN